MPLILEGLLTTTHSDGSLHLAPLGPLVVEGGRQYVLRPYPPSRTLDNLLRTRKAIFHVTDDACMIALAAIGRVSQPPAADFDPALQGWILRDACRWTALEVVHVADDGPRQRLTANVVAEGRLREFLGFNRARHALLEAAILATRTRFLPEDEIRRQLAWLAPWVEKTGEAHESETFQVLCEWIDERLRGVPLADAARR